MVEYPAPQSLADELVEPADDLVVVSSTTRRNLGYVIVAALLTGAALVALLNLHVLPFGTLETPGPGLWPVSIAALTALFCLISLWFNRERYEPMTKARVVSAALGCLAFSPLADLLGFIPASVLVLFWLLRFVGKESWLTSAIAAIVTAIVIYVIFAIALALPVDAF